MLGKALWSIDDVWLSWVCLKIFPFFLQLPDVHWVHSDDGDYCTSLMKEKLSIDGSLF